MATANRKSVVSWIHVLVAGAASLVVLTVLNPQLVLTATTPAGGDMGAHVLGPAYLRDVLIPQGRLLGWSDAWFAGFPAFYFYFPLPSLFIVFLDVFLPYGVAFKLATILGLVGLPPSVLYLARSIGFSKTVAAVAAAGSAVFALMESYTIYGGNVASTMAGEFAYSWSFSLGMVYLGLLIKAVREDTRYVPWAVAVLAATVLSHILTTLVLVLASLTVLAWRGTFQTAVRIWAWAFAITGFWTVPLLARIGLTSDMSWTPLSRWEEVFPLELWILLPFALGGLLWAMLRYPRSLPVAAAMLVPIIYYPLPGILPAFIESLEGERWKLWNGRLLPYWYFGVIFFASIAIGRLLVAATRRMPDRISGWWARLAGAAAAGGLGWLLVYREGPVWAGWALGGLGVVVAVLSLTWMAPVPTRAFLAVTVAGVLAFGSLAGTNFVFKWSRWNYSGYEAKEAWPEYQGVMARMAQLPPGRVHWEQDSTSNTGLDKYGTPMAPMLFPYWTDWTHPSMEGLFFESSLSTPFHFLNATEMSAKPSSPIPGLEYHPFDFDRGLPHLETFGVRYYVSYSTDAADKAEERAELTKVADATPFAIFEMSEVNMVEALTVQPSVFVTAERPLDGDPGNFDDFALDWYGEIDALDHIVVTDGLASWETVSRVSDMVDIPTGADAAAVSDVVMGDHSVTFRTTAVGVPHLVKVSYFPNWEAEGADGPFHSTPSLMVVVPTQEEVTLRFENTWAEITGNVLTLTGIGGLVWVAIDRRRRRGAAPPLSSEVPALSPPTP
jgi:hypothetical protein